MDIREKLFLLLSNDPDIYYPASGGEIYSILFPEDFDMSKTGIFYNVAETNQIVGLKGMILQRTFQITIVIVSQIKDTLSSLADAVEAALEVWEPEDFDVSEIDYEPDFHTNYIEINFNVKK